MLEKFAKFGYLLSFIIVIASWVLAVLMVNHPMIHSIFNQAYNNVIFTTICTSICYYGLVLNFKFCELFDEND